MVQQLIERDVFQEWTEANGTRMCAYITRSCGVKEAPTDGVDANKVRAVFFKTRFCLIQWCLRKCSHSLAFVWAKTDKRKPPSDHEHVGRRVEGHCRWPGRPSLGLPFGSVEKFLDSVEKFLDEPPSF